MVWGTTALLAALALGGCGKSAPAPTPAHASVGTRSVGGTPSLTSPAPRTVTRPGVTSGGRGRAQVPALTRMRRAIVRAAGSLGNDAGIDVVDLSTGRTLYRHRADTPRQPASLEKLYTSAAMLWALGPQARLETDLSGVGYLKRGIWHGNLYLRGDGDPTFGDATWTRVFDQGYGPTSGQLIAKLRAAGIDGVDGLLYADASRFDSAVGGPATGEAPDIPDYGGELSALVYDHGLTGPKLGPAQFAVHAVAVGARQQKFHLVASTQLASTPPGARILATLKSPPMAVMLALMLVPSDDLFAELFTKQLGYLTFGQGTLSLGAEAIHALIVRHYGIDPTIDDGSGLDKSDRSSPADIISLLRQMSGTPVGDVVRADLPTVGRNGTVQGIGAGTPAAGHCQAKTGTLNNVTNLAGYCRSSSGQLLAFTFMADGPSNGESLADFTPMVGAVASY